MSLKSRDFERIRMTNIGLYSNVTQVFGHLRNLYRVSCHFRVWYTRRGDYATAVNASLHSTCTRLAGYLV